MNFEELKKRVDALSDDPSAARLIIDYNGLPIDGLASHYLYGLICDEDSDSNIAKALDAIASTISEKKSS
jgi:hypothetical protein